VTKINISELDKYVIIASDGIWDVLDDGDVYDISRNYENSKDLCNAIVEKAIDKGSMDNISCFVIKLN
jgi:serine/threonine protein phosphatase PrpC